MSHSPSPSRKSYSKFTRTPRSTSQRSMDVRSKESSSASSVTSGRKSGGQPDRQGRPHHVEGKDRPRSRLGHPRSTDRDKGTVFLNSRNAWILSITNNFYFYNNFDNYGLISLPIMVSHLCLHLFYETNYNVLVYRTLYIIII